MFEKNLLAGRAILITGGGTGLGRSMAVRFAELGAKLHLAGRREQPLRETCDAIRAAGGAASFSCCDVRDFAAVERMAAEADAATGGIDTLVNNAAGNFIARTEKISANAFNAVLGIVLQGTFHATLALGRKWIAAGRGGNVLSIVTTYAGVGSGSGFVVPSACAKAGVLALTHSVDDTSWATSPYGAIYTTDATADTVDTVSGSFVLGTMYSVVTPCDQGNAPATCPGPGFPPNSLATNNLKTGALTPVATTGPALQPKGMIFIPALPGLFCTGGRCYAHAQ